MSKPKAPAPPDPNQVAAAQTQSNKDTASANQVLGNTNQVTPYGSVNYTYTPGPDGIRQATQTVTESDNQRQLRELSEQQGIDLGRLGIEQTGRVSDILSTPYESRRVNLSDALGGPQQPTKLSDALGGPADFGEIKGGRINDRLNLSKYDQTGLDALDLSQYDSGNTDQLRTYLRDLAVKPLERQFARDEESLRTRLANQGINAGSDAFGSELLSFTTGKGDAYAAAELGAFDSALRANAQDANLRLSERGDLLGRMENDAGLRTSEGTFNRDTAKYNADISLRESEANAARLQAQRGQQLAELLAQEDLNAGARGQNLSEILTQYGLDTTADQADRTNPLNEILALAGANQVTPINPGAPAGVQMAGTDVAGIQQQNFANQQQNYAIKQQGRNAIIGGIAGLGGAYLGAR